MANATQKTVELYDIDCELVKTSYSDGGVAVQLVSADTAKNKVAGEYPGIPFGTLSVNVPGTKHPDQNSFVVKNYQENQGIFEICLQAGLIVDTGQRVSTGHVSGLPVARLKE